MVQIYVLKINGEKLLVKSLLWYFYPIVLWLEVGEDSPKNLIIETPREHFPPSPWSKNTFLQACLDHWKRISSSFGLIFTVFRLFAVYLPYAHFTLASLDIIWSKFCYLLKSWNWNFLHSCQPKRTISIHFDFGSTTAIF